MIVKLKTVLPMIYIHIFEVLNYNFLKLNLTIIILQRHHYVYWVEIEPDKKKLRNTLSYYMMFN